MRLAEGLAPVGAAVVSIHRAYEKGASRKLRRRRGHRERAIIWKPRIRWLLPQPGSSDPPEGCVTFPGAREEDAHQLVNVSDSTLRYVCFSTMVEPDMMIYPGSGKIGVFVGAAPGAHKVKRTLSKFLKEDAEVGYFEGEE